MYKLIVSVLVFSLVFTMQAQDIKTASAYYTAKDYPNAKAAIDKALQGAEAANPYAWIWKHKIYYAIGAQAGAAPEPAALEEGFAALKKVPTLPKGEEALIKEVGINYTQVFYDYYQSFISKGSAAMNGDKNGLACQHFAAALTVSDYFFQQKLISSPLDTMIVFYAGYTAMKNNDLIKAEAYFKKIADHNCSGTDLQIAYGWLANFYLENNKTEQAKLVCEKGLNFYPGDEYLRSQQLTINRLSGNMKAVFKSFEDVLASGKAGFSDYLGYGAELYDYVYVDAKLTAAEKPQLQKRLEEVLNKALELKPASAQANYILGMALTSRAMEQQSGDKSAARPLAEKSAFYLEKAAAFFVQTPNLSAANKEHLKTALGQLVNIYKFLGNTELQAKAAQKLDALK